MSGQELSGPIVVQEFRIRIWFVLVVEMAFER